MKWKLCWIAVLTFLLVAAPAKTQDSVKIAAIYPKTGDAEASAVSILATIRYAVEEMNQKGGLLGQRIELLEYDNQSTPSGSQRAAENAVEAGVIAVVGASRSSHSLGMAPVLQKAGIPMVSPSSTNPAVTLVGDYIFRACFMDPFQGTAMAAFAGEDLEAKTAVVLTNTEEEYSLGLSEVFVQSFEKRGGKILRQGRYQTETTDFGPLLTKIKELQPDVVFVPGYARDAGSIIKQARRDGLSTVFLGCDGWGNGVELYQFGGNAVDGNFMTSHWHEKTPRENLQKLIADYREETGVLPDALSYDGVGLLFDAIRRAGSFERIRIRDALASTQGYEGVTGDITMGSKGNPLKPVVIVRWDKKERVYIKTIPP